MKNKTGRPSNVSFAFFAIASTFLVLGGCSSVFTASVQGAVVDASTGAGIGSARVFLYTDEVKWKADWNAWKDKDELPDDKDKDDYGYFMSTVSASAPPYAGSYSFDTIAWDDYFPEFGKTADRKEIWLMVSHPLYGLTRNSSPVFIVSDATNTVDPFVLAALP